MDQHVASYLSMMSSCFENFSFRCKSSVSIHNLPDELLLMIFGYLSVDDVMQCEKVCRRWRKLACDKGLWRRTQVALTGQRSEVCPKTLGIIKSHRNVVRNLKLQYILNYPLVSEITGLCRNLASLEMIMCRIQVELEEDLKRWPNLTKLNIKNSMLRSDRAIMLRFDHLKNLNYLGLSDFGLTTDNCDSLLKLYYLNHIDIEKIRGLTLEYIKNLITVKQNTLITFRIYGGDSVDDDCMLMLAQCPALKDLAVIRCENLTDRALDGGVSKFTLLTHLQLWNNSNFSEEKLIAALRQPNLTKLRRLSLSRIVNITCAIVDIISEYYKNLKFLAVYRCPKIVNSDYEKQLKTKFRNIEVVLY